MVARYHWNRNDERISRLELNTYELRSKIVNHPIYRDITNIEQARGFMGVHVFAVWDFMSILKALQNRLTCVTVPWRPIGDGLSRRLINEIVLVEESDEYEEDFLSHFELYLLAMRQAGADTRPIESFLRLVEDGDVVRALNGTGVPAPAARFVRTTWAAIEGGSSHELAAAFAFGRENLIPAMFEQVLDGPFDLALFRDYLDRHVEVDAEEHTPMAVQMVIELCGDDPRRWAQAEAAVNRSLAGRLALWDDVHALLTAGLVTADPVGSR
ncbi:DUF3050 domain-containing protein [Frankia sp. QA3]|uniref:DUF3050 domain-containing protein n=1 Tax=Frankia sp. QA3 TaxID=710111 RepID=UPI000269C04F|nr:DUF3050 domain-containing protein [Frankia sp. QA3]EIV92004.1 Protein of unknown function (DUF3050) [Frankia sp. QA3]